jgi:ubiquinone/menaquinone biosynthesis C-methylase UbiE
VDPRLIPPAELLFDGATSQEEFRNLGLGFTQILLIGRGALKQSERVLDLGSGNGQKAAALAGYLSQDGRYEGLDVKRSGIEWCQEAYRPYSNFRFTLAHELYNSHYNPGGTVKAQNYTLPYPDKSFDLAFCCSLFTHLLPVETKRYIHELGRVLAPRGRLVMTAFLLNDTTQHNRAANAIRFPHRGRRCRLRDARNPADAVALYERDVRAWLDAASLRICEVAYGTWRGTPDLLGCLQDTIVAIRDGR